ncbi:helix-turn-helix domain-containing protein [Hwangdonia seohaensis]|uniref:Helix-turn-helix domain-containing protein n=1 Tax=Hwangdonia seohaensis TaxID=1240727 RepID=A0ABW3R8M8_9FLAO|nr:AraC family transcriptional regulator [Hwangdonia seohaensis]
MTLNIYNTLILAGIIQGFIFSIVVFTSKKYRHRCIYYLIALILCFTLSNLQYFLSDAEIITRVDMHNFIFFPLGSLIPVLIYFYVIIFLYPSKKIVTQEKLLYIPFLFFLIFTFVYRVSIISHVENKVSYTVFGYFLSVQELGGLILTIAILTYLIFKLKKFKKSQNRLDFNIIHGDLNWLTITLIIFVALTLLWMVLAIDNIFFSNFSTSFYALWVSISATIYWLGYIGIYKFKVLEQRKTIRRSVNKTQQPIHLKSEKNEYIQKLEDLFQKDKIYLNPNLTLDRVADTLNISTSHLSRIINTELGVGFTEYLNRFRVEEAKRLLNTPDFFNYTIIAIGLEAGFNSKSAFFNVFKKITGKTPHEYRKGQLKEN